MDNSYTLEFPLRGTWIAPNSPGIRIPSHGTDKYGETYAYDFVGVDGSGKSDKFYDVSAMEYLFRGVPLERCYGWGAQVYAPCDGIVVAAEDGVAERAVASLGGDLKYTLDVTKRFESGRAEYREVAGNYVILQLSERAYALFAHLKANSIEVKEGQRIAKGQRLGRVGHSGNSTAPHLHFQLMDDADPKSARGLPCSFCKYEEYSGGAWQRRDQGVPAKARVRRLDE